MPELCRFNGIIIHVYYNDHLPAHFHVATADGNARIDIETLAVMDGQLAGKGAGGQ